MTDLKHPMVDLISGPAMMSLMYANVLMGCYLMLLNAPWLFMQAMMQGLENSSRPTHGSRTSRRRSERGGRAQRLGGDPVHAPRRHCAPMRRDAPVAVPKVGQCPSGFTQSGAYCIEMRRR
jgi:hypothetical protein